MATPKKPPAIPDPHPRFNFGLAAVSVHTYLDNEHLAHFKTTGQVEASLEEELIKSQGGAAGFPVSVRHGRSDGEGSFTINERTPAVDVLFGGGSLIHGSGATIPSHTPILDIAGTSLSSGLHAEVDPNSTIAGSMFLTATSTDAVNVTFVTDQGPFSFENVQLDVAATPIGRTGLKLVKSGGSNFQVGDRASFDVRPSNSGTFDIGLPQIKINRGYYRLSFFSMSGGPDDAVGVLTLNKVMVKTPNFAMGDMAVQSDISIPFQILAPEDGSDVGRWFTILK